MRLAGLITDIGGGEPDGGIRDSAGGVSSLSVMLADAPDEIDGHTQFIDECVVRLRAILLEPRE